MKEEKLTGTQWGVLLWGTALAPAAQLLPGAALDLAGRGAWLSPLTALFLLFPILWLSRRGDARLLKRTLPGRGVLLLAAVWMELLLVLRRALCARRMLQSGERDGGMWYFVLGLAVLTLWLGRGKLTAMARAGQIFLTLLLAAAALVLGLSLSTLRPDRILPLWTWDIVPLLRAGVHTAGDLCWVALPLLLIPSRTQEGKDLLLWGGGGCVLLTLAQGIVVGNLGVELSRRSESPFFVLTKSVGIEGGFQRVESVVTALWLLADLMACVILMYAIAAVLEGTVPGIHREGAQTLAVLIGAGGALWLLNWGAEAEAWDRDWIWLGSLLISVLTAGAIRWGRFLRQHAQ